MIELLEIDLTVSADISHCEEFINHLRLHSKSHARERLLDVILTDQIISIPIKYLIPH